MLVELRRKAVEWAFVKASYKPLGDVRRHKFEVVEVCDF
jgi:hypothetical protein